MKGSKQASRMGQRRATRREPGSSQYARAKSKMLVRCGVREAVLNGSLKAKRKDRLVRTGL